MGRQGLAVVISIILARLLGPKAFGLIGMVMVFTGFATVFGDMGLGAAVIQRRDLQNRHVNAVFWANLVAGITLMLVVAAAGVLIARFYKEPALKPLTACISFSFLLSSLAVVQSALLNREMKFRTVAVVEILSVSVSGAVAITMALCKFGVWSLVAQTLGASLSTVLLLWSISSWRPSLPVQWSALRDLFAFSGSLLGFNSLNYWIRNLDKLLIGKFMGSEPLGLYSRAYSLMFQPVMQISGMTSRVMFPAFAEIQHDKERVKRIYFRSVELIALVTFPLMIGVLSTARNLVPLLLGPQWLNIVPLLQVFCVIGLLQSVEATGGWIYTSQGRTDIMFKWGVGSGIVTGLSFVIGMHWGVRGVAWAYLIGGNLLLWYPSWRIVGSIIGFSFSEIVMRFAPCLLCALAMGLGIRLLDALLPQLSHLGKTLVEVPAGVLLYLGLVVAFRVAAFRELLKIAVEKRPGGK